MSTPEPSIVTVKIRKAIADLGITQFDLAVKLGLHPSALAQYLSGARKPGQLTCMLLAGLVEHTDERRYWMELADLSSAQITLVLRAIGPPKASNLDPGLLAGIEDLLTHPPDATGAAIADFLRKTVEIRARRRKKRGYE